MAAILKQATKIARQLSNQKLLTAASFNGTRSPLPRAVVSGGPVRFASSTSSFSYLEKKTAPRRLPAVYKFLLQADERTHSTGNEPIPKITLSTFYIFNFTLFAISNFVILNLRVAFGLES